MSTILKALRRLEDDDSKKKRAGAAQPPARDAHPSPSFPASDPRAADSLRSRILAEVAAARAVRSLSDTSTASSRRRPLVLTALAALAALAACVLFVALGFGIMKSGVFASAPSESLPPSFSASTPPPAAPAAPVPARDGRRPDSSPVRSGYRTRTRTRTSSERAAGCDTNARRRRRVGCADPAAHSSTRARSPACTDAHPGPAAHARPAGRRPPRAAARAADPDRRAADSIFSRRRPRRHAAHRR